jgi:alpha-tubulin suppressor-like RCC1 family protein
MVVNPRNLVGRFANPLLAVIVGSGFLLATSLSGPSQAATAPVGEYVAMGDSFSSGEGVQATANTYIPPSNTDGCDRSTGAFPEHIAESLGLNLSAFNTYPTNAFVACSGATTSDIASRFKGEPPQTNALKRYGATTKYVSLTAGGDDLGFSGVIKHCLNATVKLGALTYTESTLPTLSSPTQCSADIKSAQLKLTPGASGVSPLEASLESLYGQILKGAPKADLLVLNYPQIFTNTPTGFCPITGGFHLLAVSGVIPATAYLSLSSSSVETFDTIELELNSAIADAVQSLKASGAAIQLIDVNSGSQAQAFPCNTNTNSQSDINGVHLSPGSSLSDIVDNCHLQAPTLRIVCGSGFWSTFFTNLVAKESFHPKESLQEQMAIDVELAITQDQTQVESFSVNPQSLPATGGSVALQATVSNASTCSFSATPPVVGLPTTVPCSSGTIDNNVTIPANTGATPETYTFGLTANGAETVTANTVTLTVASGSSSSSSSSSGPIGSVVSNGDGSNCAVLTSGGVDCWGDNGDGELGNGATATDSAVPVAVVGLGGTGALSGVASLSGDNFGYCAALTSGGVDCWGNDGLGDLGNGTTAIGSDVPVAVVGLGGTGTLSGVASLSSSSLDSGFCAVLTSGGVDCWGNDGDGELGNGATATDSAVPVAVVGLGGTGALSGVASLSSVDGNYCALLTSGGVDCWGYDGSELGNGTTTIKSDVPTAVVGLGGTGTLTGVASMSSDDGNYCAVLTSGGVDCWGPNSGGELGNGSTNGSDVPVAVVGLGGTGTLSGVASLSSSSLDSGFCAVLTSGGVDCWGYDNDGQLGNGTSPAQSEVPVAVLGLGGTGTLTGVSSVSNDMGGGSCAVLASGGVDCWGYNGLGELGNGTTTDSYVPVAVVGLGGTGTLSGVSSLSSDDGDSCAVLTSGGADCWGNDGDGELGNGTTATDSDVPVAVVGVGGTGTL